MANVPRGPAKGDEYSMDEKTALSGAGRGEPQGSVAPKDKSDAWRPPRHCITNANARGAGGVRTTRSASPPGGHRGRGFTARTLSLTHTHTAPSCRLECASAANIHL